MSAYAGVQGYETLSSARQQERSSIARGLARSPSATPAHLSRVLYIPRHGSSESHLLIHAVSAEYKHTIGHAPLGGGDIIGDAPMGSLLFLTRLETIKKPKIDAEDVDAEYTVDATVDGSNHASIYIAVQKSREENQVPTAIICLPGSTVDFQIKVAGDTKVVASFPVPDTTTSAGIAQHPFFTLSPYDGCRTLQWQINPIDDGPLRYTLVDMGSTATSSDDESWTHNKTIKAIYHHVGQGSSLSMSNSEGVLLLPEENTDDLVVLSSLLGLLWRVRGLEVRPSVPTTSQEGKKTFLQRLFKG